MSADIWQAVANMEQAILDLADWHWHRGGAVNGWRLVIVIFPGAFLHTMISSCERSFSKLELILTYLRASVSQSRINSLALLSIEKETLNSIDFTSITDEFASMKARRVHL